MRLKLICLLAASLAAGCSQPPYTLVPVSGQVRLDGKPLAGAKIGFEPIRSTEAISGPGSYGETDERGWYHLVATDGGAGAVVGRHQVWIRTERLAANVGDGVRQVVAAERVPAHYNEPNGLTCEIDCTGTTTANFNLSTKNLSSGDAP